MRTVHSAHSQAGEARKASVSAAPGIAAAAPGRVQAIAAAAAPRSIAFSKGAPASSAAASTPHQQSPAPVVSIAATGKAGARKVDLLRKSGEFPVMREELHDEAAKVHEGL